MSTKTTAAPRLNRFKRYMQRNIYYYILLLLPMCYFIIFRYGPILGNVLAFRSFRPGGSAYGEAWVGLTYFKMFMSDSNFWLAFKNTLVLSFSNLAFSFTMPIFKISGNGRLAVRVVRNGFSVLDTLLRITYKGRKAAQIQKGIPHIIKLDLNFILTKFLGNAIPYGFFHILCPSTFFV